MLVKEETFAPFGLLLLYVQNLFVSFFPSVWIISQKAHKLPCTKTSSTAVTLLIIEADSQPDPITGA